MKSGLMLEVSFSEKDQVKALGAKWDPERKKWYVTEGMALAAFSQWLPNLDDEQPLVALAPFYLVKSKDKCWRCGDSTDVFCLASGGYEAEGFFYENFFVTYSYLESIPEQFRYLLAQHCPAYRMNRPNQQTDAYCMNHCRCGAKRGDHYLHAEPGGGFFPINEKQASAIVLMEIQGLKLSRIVLDASPNQQYPNPIFQFAQRQ